jgi:hypothetical protein
MSKDRAVERLMTAERENWLSTHKGSSLRLEAHFLSETMASRGSGIMNTKCKQKDCLPSILTFKKKKKLGQGKKNKYKIFRLKRKKKYL